ncbi:MAG: hypothetical protein D6768_18585 [Chloroflexi bacterium]|nr:MAG: hypothetical protein D6768_18585 [Chloroflexota bacterium]
MAKNEHIQPIARFYLQESNKFVVQSLAVFQLIAATRQACAVAQPAAGRTLQSRRPLNPGFWFLIPVFKGGHLVHNSNLTIYNSPI